MMHAIFSALYRYRFLFLVFFIAFGLRIYQLGTLPYGLHEDEMMNGYVGRFVLLNGRDLYNNKWPLLYFNNFGDYPPILPMYLSGISTFVFGVTPFAVRFPIALAGSLAVFPMYLVSKHVFAKDRHALASAFFLALLPWHVLLSRATAENITATAVHLCSLYFLFEYLKNRKPSNLVISVLLLFAKYFLYSSFRVTVPLSLFAAIFLAKDKKWRLTFLCLTLVFSLMTFSIGRTLWGQGRFKQTSLFYFNNTLSNRIEKFNREEGQSEVTLARIFHNKPIAYTREFARQYVSYFSPNFLFTDGGLPSRYLMEDSGLMPLSFLGFFFLSIFVVLLSKSKTPIDVFAKNGRALFAYLFMILLISPIPAALTLDDVPNVHRAAMVGVMLIFPITLCFAYLEKLEWRKINAQTIGILCILVEFVYFWHQFTIHMPFVQSTFRGDDRTSLAKYLVAHHKEYDKVYLPQDAKPLYYLYFGNNFDPKLAGKFGENIRLPSVDNLVFIGDNCPSQTEEASPSANSLVIDRAECTSKEGYFQIAQVMRHEGSGSFKLLQLNKTVNPQPFGIQITKRRTKKQNT
jgi:4-amino-4-deoxy-L-arabinose transferase-like glycosyltransferase